jgi:O-antigen/teichoic acid export membrane protein
MELLPKLRNRIYSLLRTSEKYTKTDMVYLAKGGFWLGFGQVGISFIAFILSITFARYVSKEVYGTYRFLLSLFWTLTAFSFTGLSAAVVRAIAQGKEGAYRQSFKYSIIGSAPMSAIAFGIAYYHFYHTNSTLGLGALAIAILGPLFQLAYLYGSFLEGKKEFRFNSYFGIILNAIPAIALLIGTFFVQNPLTFFLIYLVVHILTGASLCVWTFKKYKPNTINSENLLEVGAHFSAMNILNTISTQIDQILTFHYLGAAQLAVYSFTKAIPDQLKALFNTASVLAFPKFANRDISEIKESFWRKIIGFTFLATLVSIVFYFAAPYIFEYLFPKYADSIYYTQIYVFALIPIATIIPVAVLQAHTAKRELYIFNIASACFNITALFVLIPKYFILGAVIAKIASRVFNLALSSLLLSQFFAKHSKKN